MGDGSALGGSVRGPEGNLASGRVMSGGQLVNPATGIGSVVLRSSSSSGRSVWRERGADAGDGAHEG